MSPNTTTAPVDSDQSDDAPVNKKSESNKPDASSADEQGITFSDLDLAPSVLKTLDDVGYETPTPIQAETIPLVLAGRDVIGQAQTGTGKTAAFALPALTNIDLKGKGVQVLVLTPTRELAIQVAEAFKKYANEMKSFRVMPIYGGQDHRSQVRSLERGVHVVVGTPGRVMDHMRRGTLNLDNLQTLVLDEADEMLRMGFIDDVEWVLSKSPETRQIALFSATMPKPIRHIATTYLNDPAQVTIKVKTQTAATINQRYWRVHGAQKLDALTRLLEVEDFDGVLVFVRTKTATTDVAEKLEARGFAVAALNGDIPQRNRERTVNQLKSGKLDIIVATDVAARGLDVKRISHVINFDIPYDTEAYIHRIGRTGRAGRSGEAILFVTPRESRLLQTIERATNSRIQEMKFPSVERINDQRVARFKSRITETLDEGKLEFFQELIAGFKNETDASTDDIAAALAKLLQGDTPLLLDKNLQHQQSSRSRDEPREERGRGRRVDRERPGRRDRDSGSRPERSERAAPRRNSGSRVEEGMVRYRIEVGRAANVQPGNIVGAIANEAGLDSANIGRIEIHDDYSEVDLPEGMPKDVFKDLRKAWVGGKQLQISLLSDGPPAKRSFDRPRPAGRSDAPHKKGGHKKPFKSSESGDDRGRGGKGKFSDGPKRKSSKTKPAGAKGKKKPGKFAGKGGPAKGGPANKTGGKKSSSGRKTLSIG